jgi:hypothetical protein
LKRLARGSAADEMMARERYLTKDDRRDVVIAKYRVYETDLLLFRPDHIYATQMQRSIGGRNERYAYLFDSLDLNRSTHRRFVLRRE